MDWMKGVLKHMMTGPIHSFSMGLSSGLKKIENFLVNGIKTTLNFFLNATKWLIVTLTGLIAGLIAGFRVAVIDTQKLSKEINAIRNQTGMSTAEAQHKKLGFGAFGINANEIFGGTSNMPMFLKMRSSAMGYRDVGSTDNLAHNASVFQRDAAGGEMNRMMAIMKLKGVYGGQIPEGVMTAMNANPKKLQQQQHWDNNMQKQMGINPEAMRKYAEDLPFIQARISTVIELIKVKLATQALPMVLKIVTMIANALSTHAKAISNFLISALKFLWVQLPDLIMKGAALALAAIGFIVQGFFMLGHFVVGLVRGFETAGSGINNFVIGFLKAMDAVINGIVSAANWLSKWDLVGLAKDLAKVYLAIKALQLLATGMQVASGAKGAYNAVKGVATKSAPWVAAAATAVGEGAIGLAAAAGVAITAPAWIVGALVGAAAVAVVAGGVYLYRGHKYKLSKAQADKVNAARRAAQSSSSSHSQVPTTSQMGMRGTGTSKMGMGGTGVGAGGGGGGSWSSDAGSGNMFNYNSNMAGYYENKLQPEIAKAGKSAKIEKWLDENQDGAIDTIKKMQQALADEQKRNTKEARSKDFESMVDAVNKTTDAVKDVKDTIDQKGKDLLQNMSAKDMIGIIMAHAAEDNWLTLTRA